MRGALSDEERFSKQVVAVGVKVRSWRSADIYDREWLAELPRRGEVLWGVTTVNELGELTGRRLCRYSVGGVAVYVATV